MPRGKRPRGRPRKIWLDGVEEDLIKMGIENWKDIIHDRDRWSDFVVATKTLRGQRVVSPKNRRSAFYFNVFNVSK